MLGKERDAPIKISPVAMILVIVVPRRPARNPPIRGVHVLFKLNAANSRLNSVLEVPISLDSRVFRGPRIYVALRTVSDKPNVLSATRLTNGYQRSRSMRTATPTL